MTASLTSVVSLDEKRDSVSKEQALQAALAGLDFYVRHQDKGQPLGSEQFCANFGRFPFNFDVSARECITHGIGWSNAVIAEAMLCGYEFTGENTYLNAAGRAVSYLKSLQAFLPDSPRHYGLFRENTPQTQWAYPRDATTVAWALADWYQQTGDTDALKRSEIFARWYIDIAMEKGWPYTKVFFNNTPWNPLWCGSFHSGSAFYLHRLYKLTGKQEYLDASLRLLDMYNTKHLHDDGLITVCLDRETGESLDDRESVSEDGGQSRGWRIMHQYNDDFGTLANLAAYQSTQDSQYRDAALRFLNRMKNHQRCDGGFGPEDYSVASASGAILIEHYAARQSGLSVLDEQGVQRAVSHILGMQFRKSGHDVDGAFIDPPDAEGRLLAVARTGAYSIMALLRFAGVRNTVYGLTDE